MKDKKKIGLVLSVLVIISLIAVTIGVTYAFFNYAKEGTKDNSITTGTITFLYTETSQVGRGISIKDSYPISDSQGKLLTGEGNVFDFKVTSDTTDKSSINYEVTVRKKSTSTLDEKAVRIYLTKVSGTTEEEVLLDNYNNLTQTGKVLVSNHTEKTIYTGKVPADSTDYEQNFRLRMWIDSSIDFSPVKDENGNDTYPYNDKEFTVTVNVYANAKVVTDEEVALENNTNISKLFIGETELTQVENDDYDYETTLPEGTTSTTINIETENENATVEVERLDSLALNTSNMKRLSTQKTLDLNPGDNYFKITIKSENKKVDDEYVIYIRVGQVGDLLSDAIFNKYTTIYENPTLTDSSNNTSDASGLYKSTATNSGDPTYYFRGNVENYLDFAGFTWRVVRINEDGTIRIVMQDGINDNAKYNFNPTYSGYAYMYYSNSNVVNGAKYTLDNWYNTNIASTATYANRVVTGEYFCEEAKVKYSSDYTSGNATMKLYNDITYTPSFSCSEDDGNQKGIVNASVGLITYDEVLHAGAYYGKSNSNYYLYNNTYWWTMSPGGVDIHARVWNVHTAGSIYPYNVYNTHTLRPVLNLKADTNVTGLGTSDSHWIVAN